MSSVNSLQTFPLGYLQLRREALQGYDPDNQSISYVPVDRLEFSITFADVHRDYVRCKKCTRISVKAGRKGSRVVD